MLMPRRSSFLAYAGVTMLRLVTGAWGGSGSLVQRSLDALHRLAGLGDVGDADGARPLPAALAVAAEAVVPTLREKRIHPHSLRHTTAVSMLKSGVDFPTISQWLGHASLDTTMRYSKADIDMKRQALLQVFPDILTTAPTDRRTFERLPTIEWLKRL